MSSLTEKLVSLDEKIKTLTASTGEFKEKMKTKIIALKPKIAEIARKAKACSFNDEETEQKRQELERLLKEKDELFKSYIKKDDLEKEGFIKGDEVSEKIAKALQDLGNLIESSTNGNKEIEGLVTDIEQQLNEVEKELQDTKVQTESMERKKLNEMKVINQEDFDENTLGNFFDEEKQKQAGGKSKRRRKRDSRKKSNKKGKHTRRRKH